MRVINFTDKTIKEQFPVYGVVEVKAGEVKDIPDEVASVWMDAGRQTVMIKPYSESISHTNQSDIDYSILSYKEMLKLAKERGLKLPQSINKNDLLKLLQGE